MIAFFICFICHITKMSNMLWNWSWSYHRCIFYYRGMLFLYYGSFCFWSINFWCFSFRVFCYFSGFYWRWSQSFPIFFKRTFYQSCFRFWNTRLLVYNFSFCFSDIFDCIEFFQNWMIVINSNSLIYIQLLSIECICHFSHFSFFLIKSSKLS